MQPTNRVAAGKQLPAATAVAIGMFDGVHRGHQALIRRAVALARENDVTPLVLTFDRHADEVLRPDRARPYLTTLSEKLAAIRALGVQAVVVAKVTPAFLAVSARDFVQDYLCGQLHARFVVVGHDFRFGHGREGDVGTLKALRKQGGYQVEAVEPVQWDGETVSSTRIRRLLSAGEVKPASELLGRPYQLRGPVERGEGVGRQLGFPTANVAYPAQKILPALGVYLCRARTDGREYGAAVNVGRRPTFGARRITVEAHLLDFAGDLYGRPLVLEFLERLRPEQRFASLEELRAQIAADVERARAVLGAATPCAGGTC